MNKKKKSFNIGSSSNNHGRWEHKSRVGQMCFGGRQCCGQNQIDLCESLQTAKFFVSTLKSTCSNCLGHWPIPNIQGGRRNFSSESLLDNAPPTTIVIVGCIVQKRCKFAAFSRILHGMSFGFMIFEATCFKCGNVLLFFFTKIHTYAETRISYIKKYVEVIQIFYVLNDCSYFCCLGLFPHNYFRY